MVEGVHTVEGKLTVPLQGYDQDSVDIDVETAKGVKS